jgi:cysteine synthase A
MCDPATPTELSVQRPVGLTSGASSLTSTVGGTPLVDVSAVVGHRLRLLVKLESRNPSGSVKDRVAVAMVQDAERDGRLHRGMTLLEATGGNTGIGLAVVAAERGYPLILAMPDAMSNERVALLRHLGAEIVLTSGILMAQAQTAAARIAATRPDVLYLDQFTNPSNVAAHVRTTGPEIWAGTGGEVDVVVSAVGTGGTLTGCMSYLRKKKPSVRAVAVEPATSAVLSGGAPGQHKMPGIGVGFVPPLLDRSLVHATVPVSDDDAYAMSRRVASDYGLLCGPSGGAALHAAIDQASDPSWGGATVVVILADSAERYVTTDLLARKPEAHGAPATRDHQAPRR